MIIYFRELIRNRNSLIIWSLTMLGFSAMMMAFFPTIAGEADKMEEYLSLLPETMKSIFNLDKLSMSNIVGYYATETYIFVNLLGSIYSMFLASSIISKEENDKTIEFLLAKPVKRTTIVTSKALCVLTNILLFNLSLTIFNYLMFEIYKTEDYSLTAFLLLSVGPLLLHLTFATIGLLISVFVQKTKAVYSISIGVILGTYFISIISSLSEKVQNLKYLSPFKYVDSAQLAIEEKISGIYLLIMAVIIILSVTATYMLYKKKDITI